MRRAARVTAMFSPVLAIFSATFWPTAPSAAASACGSSVEGAASRSVVTVSTSAWNSGVRATKSVSQFTSATTPSVASAFRRTPTRPSFIARPAFFATCAMPFLRRMVIASSMSPFASVSAALQSIMPAPVRSRRALTSVAVIVAIDVST